MYARKRFEISKIPSAVFRVKISKIVYAYRGLKTKNITFAFSFSVEAKYFICVPPLPHMHVTYVCVSVSFFLRIKTRNQLRNTGSACFN